MSELVFSRKSEYQYFIKRKSLVILCLIVILITITLISISIGSSGLTIAEVVQAILGKGNKQISTIVWNVRIPRILTGIVVGIALSISGCIMQNVLRNPLASSSTIGVTQGASFGAAFAIVFLDAGTQINASTAAAVSITNPYIVTIFAFLGGIVTICVILGLSRFTNITPVAMILAGVALSSLFTGGTTLVQYFADDVKIASIVYWTFGDLGRAGWKEIGIIFLSAFIAFMYFFFNRWNYNAMETGIETAKSLGIDVDRLMLISMVFCTLTTAISVAFVGSISFIGLIAPHLVRRFVGNDYRFLILASGITGAIIVVLAELVSRIIVTPSILPIGALTSFLGAPLFLYLIYKGGVIK
jgi:iron complex transport system permease protein